jgi:hypothetical protein
LAEAKAVWSPVVPEKRADRRSNFGVIRWVVQLGAAYFLGPTLGFLAYAAWPPGGIAGPDIVACALVLAAVAVMFLLVWSARSLAAAKVRAPSDLTSDLRFTTPWRLCDPTSSHWGLWRADLPFLPHELESAHGRALVKKYIQKLMDDWSRTSARGGSAIRIFGELSRTRGPFGDDRPGCKVYRITLLDASEVRRTGWLRLGPNWVEFQLVPGRGERELSRGVSYETEMNGPASTTPPTGSLRSHPMWDHWLDG